MEIVKQGQVYWKSKMERTAPIPMLQTDITCMKALIAWYKNEVSPEVYSGYEKLDAALLAEMERAENPKYWEPVLNLSLEQFLRIDTLICYALNKFQVQMNESISRIMSAAYEPIMQKCRSCMQPLAVMFDFYTFSTVILSRKEMERLFDIMNLYCTINEPAVGCLLELQKQAYESPVINLITFDRQCLLTILKTYEKDLIVIEGYIQKMGIEPKTITQDKKTIAKLKQAIGNIK